MNCLTNTYITWNNVGLLDCIHKIWSSKKMDRFSFSSYLILLYINTILVVSIETTVHPRGMIASKGSNVTFTCNISKQFDPKKVYWWHYPKTRSDDPTNAENLSGVKCSNSTQGGSIQMNITGVTSSHTGLYSCNADGEGNENTSELIVLEEDIQCGVFLQYNSSESQHHSTTLCSDDYSVDLICIIRHKDKLFSRGKLWQTGVVLNEGPVQEGSNITKNVMVIEFRITEIKAYYNVSIELSRQLIDSSRHIPTKYWISPNIEHIHNKLCNEPLSTIPPATSGSMSGTTGYRSESIVTTEGIPSMITAHTIPPSTLASVTTGPGEINPPAASTDDKNEGKNAFMSYEAKILLIPLICIIVVLAGVSIAMTYLCMKARNTRNRNSNTQNQLDISYSTNSQLPNSYLQTSNNDSRPTTQDLNIGSNLHRHYEKIPDNDQPNVASNNIQRNEPNLNNLTTGMAPVASKVLPDRDENLSSGYLHTLRSSLRYTPDTTKFGKMDHVNISEGSERKREPMTIPKQHEPVTTPKQLMESS